MPSAAHGSKRSGERLSLAALALAACLGGGLSASPAAAAPKRLLLDVAINGTPTGLVASFTLNDDGVLAVTRAELEQLHLPSDRASDATPVPLASIGGLTYRYDEANQAVAITITPDLLPRRRIDAGATASEEDAVEATPSTGAVLSYSLFAAATAQARGPIGYSTASALLDGRLYGPVGEIRQTGLFLHDGHGVRALRLDTAAVRVDAARDLLVTVGDSISAGPTWSNAVRMGGIQIQRDFSTRPDLVTTPLPSISGSAVVPSTLDLYVDGVKRLSTDVPAGRFTVDDLPAVVGGGVARLALRDVQGREVRTAAPFYVSDRLLRPGLVAFSLETGFARRDYGVRSFGYAAEPFASASSRFGLAAPLTIELHAEASPRLLLGGIGAAVPTGTFGVVSGAISGSAAGGRNGALVQVAFEAGTGPFRFAIQTRRTRGAYLDVAALSVRARDQDESGSDGAPDVETWQLTPEVSDRATLSLPRVGVLGALSVSYAHERRRTGDTASVGSLFYSRAILGGAAFTASAFRDFRQRGSTGAFAGLSLPFGGRTTASANISSEAGRVAYGVEASRSMSPEPGSLGWRMIASGGQRSFQAASVDYQTSAATLRAEVANDGGRAHGSLSAQGTLVLSGSLFAAPSIGSSFAVIDAKLPGVRVLQENNPVGRTNKAGLLLVTGVRPFERNAFSVDEDSLPLDARIAQNRIVARPTGLNGSSIRFAVETGDHSAVLRLVDEKGVAIAVGALVSVNGAQEQMVGYDGLVLVSGLRARNLARVQSQGRTCSLSFDLAPSGAPGGALATLGPLACRNSSAVAMADRR